jgi:protein involved in polysaccharide export with SLBB domain
LEIWGGVAQRLSRTVDREGRLALPEAGPVVVAGLTLAQANVLFRCSARSAHLQKIG